jgi:hypothetical protein
VESTGEALALSLEWYRLSVGRSRSATTGNSLQVLIAEKDMQPIVVTRDNKAVLTCPACDRTKIIDVSPYIKHSRAVKIKIKCPCGHHHPVALERRRHFRKTVNFQGSFAGTGRHKGGMGKMVVRDLSQTGLKFQINDTTSLCIGDTILVAFELDDSKRSPIRKESVVRRTDGADLGVEFLSADPSDPNTQAIGFYLLA